MSTPSVAASVAKPLRLAATGDLAERIGLWSHEWSPSAERLARVKAPIESAMRAACTLDSVNAVEFEIRTFVEYRGKLPDGREGYEASLEGRPPSWY